VPRTGLVIIREAVRDLLGNALPQCLHRGSSTLLGANFFPVPRQVVTPENAKKAKRLLGGLQAPAEPALAARFSLFLPC
jgi:hypothetical protein